MTTHDDAGRPEPKYRASGLNEVIAQNVSRLRVKNALTQAELARRAGMGRLAIVGIEQGSRLVAVNDLAPICFALQCSLADLIEGDGDRPLDKGGMPLMWARRFLLPEERPSAIERALRQLVREEMSRANSY